MFLWFLAALVFRWRFQFSIRSLLLLPVVVAITCGWLARALEASRQQREAIAAIRKLGGVVSYDYYGGRFDCEFSLAAGRHSAGGDRRAAGTGVGAEIARG